MSSSSSLIQGQWIKRFLQSDISSNFLCEIDRSYIEDSFNLYGLRNDMKHFSRSINIILDKLYEDSDVSDPFDKGAVKLYGLIHARYILTANGQEKMYRMYKKKCFGQCPRLLCDEVGVLPLGESDSYGTEPPRLFCPKCEEVFFCPLSTTVSPILDGAFFGTTFPHFFMLNYGTKVKIYDDDSLDGSNNHNNDTKSAYTPRVFGFRIYDPNRHAIRLALMNNDSSNAPPTMMSSSSGSAKTKSKKRAKKSRKSKKSKSSSSNDKLATAKVEAIAADGRVTKRRKVEK